MPLAILAVIGAMMWFESRLSIRNERALRARGAVEPAGDVYRWMQVAYPGSFALMAFEGHVRGSASVWWLAGSALFVVAKSLKYWAIASLGSYWSFRVLVVPGAPLVTRGPYRYLRHPNYIAVIGELLGGALLLNALVTGPIVTLLFVELIRRRLAVEERALFRP
jgi:methyltransferase